MMKIYLTLLSLALVFAGQSYAVTESNAKGLIQQAAEFSELIPERKQREASIHIARSLLLSHYRKQDIDKKLSEKVYDNYLSSLDSQHLYFLKSDIEEFDPYRFRLHGALKTGQLEPGFNIYNRFQQRFIERLTYKLKLLENNLKDINFDKEEFILTDRENAPWAETKQELNDVWRRRIKSAALSIKLNGETLEEATETLRKRYENQLKRSLQVRSEDAFQAYMNAFTTVYDPHTNYFSPRSSETSTLT